MSPSISISVSNEIYQLLLEYRNENSGMSQSHAGASLIKMGFAWNEQTKEFIKEQNAIKAASVNAITKTVKTAQKPKARIKLKV